MWPIGTYKYSSINIKIKNGILYADLYNNEKKLISTSIKIENNKIYHNINGSFKADNFKNIYTINIGTNFDSNKKIINLTQNENNDTVFCMEDNIYQDIFKFSVDNNNLIVERIDSNQGWRYSHKCFVYQRVIPRILLQTHHSNLPNYVKNKLMNKAVGWDYKFFKDNDIIRFFRNHPIDDFPNIAEIFNSIKKGQHKADLFRYYFLYIYGGVFLDSDAMIEKNLDNIIKQYEFVTVICKDESLYFNGFIATQPNNIIMYESIKDIYNCNKKQLNEDYFYIVRNFKKIVDKNIDKYNTKLFAEDGDWTGTMPTVDKQNNNELIFNHYYGSKIVPR